MKKRLLLTLVIISLFCYSLIGQNSFSRYLFTVNGKIPADSLKFTRTREHVRSKFSAKPESVSNYHNLANLSPVLPYLLKIKSLEENSIFDCTGAFFGRNVLPLKIL